MKTTEYLDMVKAEQGLKSDYQLAKTLELETSNITMYRKHRRVMDNYIATKIAQILGINPMAIIAQAEAEREKNEDKRAFWEAFAKKAQAAVCIAALPLVTNFVTMNDAKAYSHTKEEAKKFILCQINQRFKFELNSQGTSPG